MSRANQQLFDYVQEKILVGGDSPENVKKLLLDNDWPESTINEVFADLDINVRSSESSYAVSMKHEHSAAKIENQSASSDFARENITMDKIIEKFIPIAGAIFLIVGLGYLIYANAWVNLSMEIRLTLGFFLSVVIIGGSFSFSEKMKYFTDIGIGSGVLLLYGTLMYGSRASELAADTAVIPEAVTLITALAFTVAVSYFASKRNSKVILILGMIGAYITPFVVGQNEVWVGSMSFNSYLIYFFAVNLAVFFIGREISVRDIIPLNIIGLFIGVSTLWGLVYSDGINATSTGTFFGGEIFTGLLFLLLVVFSIWSILLSAKKFSEKDDGYLSLGYIAPVIWFAFNVSNLESLDDTIAGISYAIIATSCFAGWHYLEGIKTRFQHTALYAAGLLSVLLAIFAFFQEFNLFTSILMAYSSLIFAALYMLDSSRSERFISYILVSLAGSVLSLRYILDADLPYQTLLVVIALIPAMSAYFVAKNGDIKEIIPQAAIYSIGWSTVALMFVIAEFIDYIDVEFLLFYMTPLILLCYLAYVNKTAPDKMSHDRRSLFLRLTLFLFAFGFASAFFMLLVSIYPAPKDTYIFTHTNLPIDWLMIKGIVATAILFVGLWISRKLQLEQVVRRPSFILVIFGFSTLLLAGNYIISAIANDLNVAHIDGGPRAIATTIWWASIAIYMLYKGVKMGKKYHSEKLLGLLLLGITLVKVILYDIATMDMQNKIIVLMIVGGAMLLFSYRVRSKNLIKIE